MRLRLDTDNTARGWRGLGCPHTLRSVCTSTASIMRFSQMKTLDMCIQVYLDLIAFVSAMS